MYQKQSYGWLQEDEAEDVNICFHFLSDSKYILFLFIESLFLPLHRTVTPVWDWYWLWFYRRTKKNSDTFYDFDLLFQFPH